MPFSLPQLPYSYNALEPYIDALTMEIHYTKHHQAYVTNLNKALEAYPELQKKSLEDLLKEIATVPEAIRDAVRNNAGGHYNHSFFWPLMTAQSQGEPVGLIAEKIKKKFGSFEEFKEQFSAAAKSVFGSGWAWLGVDAAGELVLFAMPNQDAPIMQGIQPVLGLDVWEHAYYLHYQNRRPDYISAWWSVVNWGQVEDNYRKLL